MGRERHKKAQNGQMGGVGICFIIDVKVKVALPGVYTEENNERGDDQGHHTHGVPGGGAIEVGLGLLFLGGFWQPND